MNLIALNAVRAALRKELKRLDDIKPGCSTCKHYELNHCGAYDQQPPGEWFNPNEPVDCESWVFDNLPF